MQTIKVDTTDKGLNHWENTLLKKQEARLNRLLNEINASFAIKQKVLFIFEKVVDKTNIIPLASHPIRVFLQHMINDDLQYLIDNSTSQNFIS